MVTKKFGLVIALVVTGMMMFSGCSDDEEPAPALAAAKTISGIDCILVEGYETGAFYIGKYEITQKQYEDVMGENPSKIKGENLPVHLATFNEVEEFISKVGNNCRLLDEKEWEFAAKGGNKSKGYTYSGSNTIGDVAWYLGNTVDNDQGITQQGNSTLYKTIYEVGTKAANELGIYDMSGNLSEWTSTTQTQNGELLHIARGGASSDSPEDCGIKGSRTGGEADGKYYDIGIRVAFPAK